MTSFRSLLPPNASALERRLEQVLARIEQIDVPIRDLWNPATCPLALLPWLAWALSVDTWRSDWPEATKRAVVAASPSVHRLKGTAGAVKRAVAAVADGKPYRVVTWYEPEGSGLPYTAFVEIDFTTVDLSTAQASAGDVISAVAGAQSARDRITVRFKAGFTEGLRVAARLRACVSLNINGSGTVQPSLAAGVRVASRLRASAVGQLRGAVG